MISRQARNVAHASCSRVHVVSCRFYKFYIFPFCKETFGPSGMTHKVESHDVVKHSLTYFDIPVSLEVAKKRSCVAYKCFFWSLVGKSQTCVCL